MSLWFCLFQYITKLTEMQNSTSHCKVLKQNNCMKGVYFLVNIICLFYEAPIFWLLCTEHDRQENAGISTKAHWCFWSRRDYQLPSEFWRQLQNLWVRPLDAPTVYSIDISYCFLHLSKNWWKCFCFCHSKRWKIEDWSTIINLLPVLFSVGQSWGWYKHPIHWHSCSERRFCQVFFFSHGHNLHTAIVTF